MHGRKRHPSHRVDLRKKHSKFAPFTREHLKGSDDDNDGPFRMFPADYSTKNKKN